MSGKINFKSATFTMNVLRDRKAEKDLSEKERHTSDPADPFPIDYNCMPAILCCGAAKVRKRDNSLGKRKQTSPRGFQDLLCQLKSLCLQNNHYNTGNFLSGSVTKNLIMTILLVSAGCVLPINDLNSVF